MNINLRRLEDEGEGRGALSARERVELVDAFEERRTIDCEIELTWEQRGGAFFFHGDLTGELPTKCHRCLVDVPTTVTGEFDVVIRRGGVRGSQGDEDAEETRELVTLAPGQYEFSFDQYIVENLIVNIPIQILCKEDCKGLCQQCGINRNETSCDCAAATDPRWDALRKLEND
ncbi:MAG: DUF177 domain-containing protein [Candidatus Latescibacterota bacterium]|jgi:uncharacterized protein